ncbi:hypothetical protein [Pseudomonas sediminis]|uniref:Uncharacterized protein n=1 Tax=Pseudomonas sediminis TaxID=1691904 RepID=A0ABX6SI42_9PSED|nr:hypothetical protein [Pseudomonas sediminis]QNH01469.1 hypothetical protein HNQ25_01700 [Pseudomonas sediminis]
MESTKANNQIKWLLIDQMTDLTAAVCMGRELIAAYNEKKLTQPQITARLRVCNHSLILSLYKVWEIKDKYNRHLYGLDETYVGPLFKYAKEIDKKNINKFRGRYAAHIWDLKDKPISLNEAKELLETITGVDNSKVQEFYDWIWNDGEPCVVSALFDLIEHLKTMPGGDLARF